MTDFQTRLARGFRHHEAGDLAAATPIYESLLAEFPEQAEISYLLGTLRYQQGALTKALPLLQQSLTLNPTHADAISNLASVLNELGRCDEALAHYATAIRLAPGSAQALSNRGVMLMELGRLDEAAKDFQSALELAPESTDALNNLTTCAVKQGDIEGAEAYARRAVEIAPGDPRALSNLGALLCQAKRYQDAIEPLEQAIAIAPDLDNARLNLGKAWSRLKQLAKAREQVDAVIDRNPGNIEALLEKSRLLIDAGEFANAGSIAFYLLHAEPDNPVYLRCLAHALLHSGLHTEARRYLDRLEEVAPGDPAAAYISGVSLSHQNRLAEAIVAYEDALRLGYDEARTRWNRSLCLLSLGNFPEGFSEYDWRFHPDCPIGPHGSQEPEWDGSELNGQGILIHSEQGSGDIIQFMRYMRLVQECGGNIFFESGQAVWDLLTAGDDEPPASTAPLETGLEQAQQSWTVQVPLLSLPKVFGTTVDTIPWHGPYVAADSSRAAIWRERFAQFRGLKIGIVWAGSPTHSNDHNRSCRLSDFSPLAKIPGVHWVSLQKGPPAAQAFSPPPGMDIDILDEHLRDFADTAAVIENLDIVITVDTSVAHLAGAMGRQVWMLLAFRNDWRWMLDRTDSPWYPGMRFFRQKRQGDWDGLFAEVVDALRSDVVARKQQLDLADAGVLSAYEKAQAGDVDAGLSDYRALFNVTLLSNSSLFHHARFFASTFGCQTAMLNLIDPDRGWGAKLALALLLDETGRTTSASEMLAGGTQWPDITLDAARSYVDLLIKQGKNDMAIEAAKDLSARWPKSAAFRFLAGRAHQRKGETARDVTHYNTAATYYKEALDIDPGHPGAKHNLGVLQMVAERYDEAVMLLQAVVRQRPLDAMAWGNLGAALNKREDYALAEIYIRHALSLNPAMTYLYADLGLALAHQDRPSEAVDAYRVAIAAMPEQAELHASVGAVFRDMEKWDQAIAAAQEALLIDPENVLAHRVLLWCYLPNADFKNGWREYEWRFRHTPVMQRHEHLPLWDGSPLNGRKLLVFTDQGFGDAIQFLRFLPLVEGGNVTLECQDALFDLVRASVSWARVVPRSVFDKTSPQDFDLRISLVSLPALFSVDEAEIRRAKPYVNVDPIRKRRFSDRLGGAGPMRVGLVWATNTDNKNGKRRSMTFADAEPLLKVLGVKFVSLQKGDVVEEMLRSTASNQVINLDQEIGDFADTAAAIANLDLVIGVDTSVVHVAGAIGVPVWTLVQKPADWRWLLHREDSPWYPTMRLFRQQKEGDWESVIAQVAEALASLVQDSAHENQ